MYTELELVPKKKHHLVKNLIRGFADALVYVIAFNISLNIISDAKKYIKEKRGKKK